jgi:hypothetical protein
MNHSDIIIICILAALVIFAIRSVIRRGLGCGGNCDACKHRGEKCPENKKGVR